NDPYRGGTHLNDVTLIVPLFDEAGNLIVFPAVRAHWVDVGGMVPGSYSGRATNVYQEGLRIPIIKIAEKGRINKAALDLMLANMRLPQERLGDFNASLGACKIAESRIRTLVARYGWATVKGAVALHLDRTERRLRERIAALPDGTYCYEDYLEFYDDGRLDPVLARVALTVAGDQITADFAGSNPQVPGVVNSSLAVAGAGVFVAIKSTLDPGGAVNDGAFRPITLKAPEASIFDVRLDAPAGAHGEVRKRALSVTLGALAQIMPELVSGDLCGSSFPNAMGGWNARRKRPYVYFEFPAGGNGGFAEADGSSAFVNVDFGNLPSIQNAEVLENEMPVLVERCALHVDGGGEGARRGGSGLERAIRLLDAEATYSCLSDRAVIPPFGILGGGSGAPYEVAIRRGRRVIAFDTPGKVTGHPVQRDDVLLIRSSGGGGYGDPLARDPALVAADVARGTVSRARARDGYGVALNRDGSVDEGKTRTLRRQLDKARCRVAVRADDRIDPYVGKRGRRRVLDLAPALAKALKLRDGDLLEILGRHPAPLRAWARITPEAKAQAIALDAFGRRVLGVESGDRVVLRRVATPDLPLGMAG
ncbi:MAG: hydantoinase B/oxoprolinase family protein, partial [Alphaproteobacteria bacterium]|nr:hydantoinase B/oxoprolinase family protein [Alphaproteobacteria bacterium]